MIKIAIHYFPTPYKDEIFYSIIGRYQSHVMNVSNVATMKELFNAESYCLKIESPKYLIDLVEKLKYFNDKLTRNYLLSYYTLAPFIRPFQGEEWLEKIIISSSVVKSHKGLGNFKGKGKPTKEYLYYCTECLKNEFEEFGEGYWNRIFQCPGVFVCIKHQIFLTRYPINIIKETVHPFLLLKKEDIYAKQLTFCENIIPYLINLAEDIKYIFDSNFDSFSKKYLFGKYQALLAINNIAFPILERQRKLGELMLNYYPKEFLKMLDSDFEIEDKSNWLIDFWGEASMYRSYPIRHLLIMRCLCGSAKKFFEEDFVFEPFGKGPWLCMNKLADHYLEKCVETIEVTLHTGNRRIQGEFRCNCGFTYRLREWEQDPLEVPYFSNRIMKKGRVWEEKFESLVKNGATLKELSLYTGFSEPTIQKVIREKKQERKDNNEIGILKEEQKRKKTEEYKLKWIMLRELYPNYNRRELNNIDRSVYCWLRKYEPQWIEEHSPPSKKGMRSKIVQKKEYCMDDRRFLMEAQKIVEEWEEYEKRKGKLVRKAKTSFFKILALPSRYQDIERYPLTIEYISIMVETVEDFQKRRIHHILQTSFQNKKVTMSQIKELAGVKKYIRLNLNGIGKYLEEMVRQHNQNLIP